MAEAMGGEVTIESYRGRGQWPQVAGERAVAGRRNGADNGRKIEDVRVWKGAGGGASGSGRGLSGE